MVSGFIVFENGILKPIFGWDQFITKVHNLNKFDLGSLHSRIQALSIMFSKKKLFQNVHLETNFLSQ